MNLIAVQNAPNYLFSAGAGVFAFARICDRRSTYQQGRKFRPLLHDDYAFQADGRRMSVDLLQTLEGHSNSVNAVAFSPDGKLLASALSDKTVKLWDASTGAALQTLKVHSNPVDAVALSPDGKLLALASKDGTVKLWDAGTGAALQTLEGHSYSVNAVAFLLDGKLLASASYEKTVKLWDAVTGAVLQTLKVDAFVRTFLFPDNRTFLKTNRGLLRTTFNSLRAVPFQQNVARGIFAKEQ